MFPVIAIHKLQGRKRMKCSNIYKHKHLSCLAFFLAFTIYIIHSAWPSGKEETVSINTFICQLALGDERHFLARKQQYNFFPLKTKYLVVSWRLSVYPHPFPHIKSLFSSDAIWRERSWSTLAQGIACCLTVPSQLLNQCWLWFIFIRPSGISHAARYGGKILI